MKTYTYLVFLLLLSPSIISAQELITGKDIAVTSTEYGQVRGYIHNGIYTYKGIPYAQAKRFEVATKPKPWEGVRSSTTYGPVAPLITPTTQVNDEPEFVFDHDWGYTSEDCLRINIWTPSISDGKKELCYFGYMVGDLQLEVVKSFLLTTVKT